MRLTTSIAPLLIAAAALAAVGLSPIAIADPPATDSAVALVIEDTARPPHDCPYA